MKNNLPAQDRVITVNGQDFTVRFNGFDKTLRVKSKNGNGKWLSLPPCHYRDHISVLRQCLGVNGPALTLEPTRFCNAVVDRFHFFEEDCQELAPIALWWFCGGGAGQPTVAVEEGWYPLTDGIRAYLRPWSERERQMALLACLLPQDAEGHFDAVGYWDAMVRASVLALEPEQALEKLHAQASVLLLGVVVALNTPRLGTEVNPKVTGLTESHGEQRNTTPFKTERLCQLLGWTPNQLWSKPAIEVDKLLHAFHSNIETDVAESTFQMQKPRFEDLPGAVLIQVEKTSSL